MASMNSLRLICVALAASVALRRDRTGCGGGWCLPRFGRHLPHQKLRQGRQRWELHQPEPDRPLWRRPRIIHRFRRGRGSGLRSLYRWAGFVAMPRGQLSARRHLGLHYADRRLSQGGDRPSRFRPHLRCCRQNHQGHRDAPPDSRRQRSACSRRGERAPIRDRRTAYRGAVRMPVRRRIGPLYSWARPQLGCAENDDKPIT
jgi:hypothetical protein